MKTCAKCQSEKPLSEYYLDRGYPMSTCKECKKKREREKAQSNPDANRRRVAEWASSNPDRVASKRRRFRKNNPGIYREAEAEWARNNRHLVNSHASNRRASIKNATPGWADQKAINQYYLLAAYLTIELGVEFHVDHVVPLQSKSVQGFHSEHNLSVALGNWNQRKSNLHWPDMP